MGQDLDLQRKSPTPLHWRGPYDAAETYFINDLVSYSGYVWRLTTPYALGVTPPAAPPPNNIWDLFAALSTSGGGAMTGAQIEAAVDLFEGSTNWRLNADLSIANRGVSTLDIASSIGSSATVPAATASLTGLMSAADKAKLNGIAAGAGVFIGTDLSIGTRTTTTVDIDSSTGAAATLAAADASHAGLLTAAYYTKLTNLATDTDGTLAADSDALIATQKATKTYVDTAVATALLIAGHAGLSVLGVTGSGSGNAADIVGAADQVLRVNTAGTALAFGTVATAGIANSAVTLAKMANLADQRIIGNVSGGSAAPSALTAAQVKTMLAISTGDVSGLSALTLDFFAPPAGDVSMNSHKLTSVATPTAATDAANKAYVDSLIVGLTMKPTARLATAAVLPSYTYLANVITAAGNGPLSIDSTLVVVGDVVLIKDETGGNAPYNGLYTVTAAGDNTGGGHPFILTRHADMNLSSEFSGAFIPVNSEGPTNANSLWLCNNTTPPTVGVTNITFIQLNKGTDLQQGAGITISGNTVSISSAAITFAMIHNVAALSVFGRSANSAGVGVDISAVAASGTVLREAGSTIGFGTIATAGIADAAITYAKVANGTGLSVIGRSASSSGVNADIAGTADQFFQVNHAGSSLAFVTMGGDATLNSGTLTIAAAAISYAKIQNIAALSVMGRSANSSGVGADISAVAASGAVLRESGSTIGFGTVATAGIANSAITYAKLANGTGLSVIGVTGSSAAANADIVGTADQVLRINTAGTALGFGTIATGGIAAAAVTYAKIQDGAGLSVVGRSASSSGVNADIVGTADQFFQVNHAGSALAFVTMGGDATLNGGTLTIAAAAVSYAKIANVAALSVMGRSANSSGVPADISAVAASGAVLRESGSTIGFGTVATAGIANSAITYAKIANGTGLSVVGVAGASATANADIVGAADQFLQVNHAATALAFTTMGGDATLNGGTLTVAAAAISYAKIQNIAGLSVMGRSANSSGVGADITGVDGNVLRVAGTALGFGAIATAGITDAAVTYAKIANGTGLSVIGRSANSGGVNADIVATTNQVLRESGGILGFGGINIASTAAINGAIVSPGSTVRSKATQSLGLYVRKDGNDSNNGQTDNAGGAFLTLQGAMDWVAKNLDFGQFQPIINVRAGSFAPFSVGHPWTGSNYPLILGQTAIAISAAANNGSGLIRLTVSSTAGWTTGNAVYVRQVTGTTEANGYWTITVIDGTHIDLQSSTFTNAYVSGGNVVATLIVATGNGQILVNVNDLAVLGIKEIGIYDGGFTSCVGFQAQQGSIIDLQQVTYGRLTSGVHIIISPLANGQETGLCYIVGSASAHIQLFQGSRFSLNTSRYIYSGLTISFLKQVYYNSTLTAGGAVVYTGPGTGSNTTGQAYIVYKGGRFTDGITDASWPGATAGIDYAIQGPAAAVTSGALVKFTDTTGNNIGAASAADITAAMAANQKIESIEFVIDGGGSALTTGMKGYIEVPFGFTITQVTTLADVSGSVVVDIFKCTYAQFDAGSTHPVSADKITSSTPPTISSATKAQDSTLTSWTTAISAGDILGFNVNSATTVTRVTVSIKGNKT